MAVPDKNPRRESPTLGWEKTPASVISVSPSGKLRFIREWLTFVLQPRDLPKTVTGEEGGPGTDELDWGVP